MMALMTCSVLTSCADKEELKNELAKTIAGNYNVTSSFDPAYDGYGPIYFNFSSVIHIGNDPKKITIGNFSGSGQDITADLESTTSLKINNQTIGLNTINGTGSINGSTITLNYTYTGSITGGVSFCTDVYTKI